MSALWLLGAYGLGIFAMSLIGGALPSLIEITHRRMQVIMAAVAGLIIGVALFHLLPHSVKAIPGEGAVEVAVAWMVLGLVMTLVMLYMFDFHEHDFSEEHGHQHDEGGRHAPRIRSYSWIGIALGLGVHSATEGIALSSTLRLVGQSEATLAGIGVFLAIALHKPLDALSIVSTMKLAGAHIWARRIANLSFALLCPLAAFGSYWFAGQLGGAETLIIGCALAFAAGTFLCISLSDLLPEAHFHTHDRLLLTASFLVGVAIAYGLHWVEPSSLHT